MRPYILILLLVAGLASAYECNETDAVLDFTTKGTVYFGPKKVEDSCVVDEQGKRTLLLEAYCLGEDIGLGKTEGIGYYWVRCPDGCIMGACNGTYENLPCDDDDYDNIYRKGSGYAYPIGNFTDCCVDGPTGPCVLSGSHVIENFCDFSDPTGRPHRKDSYECENGCYDGACIADGECLSDCTRSGEYSRECDGINGCSVPALPAPTCTEASCDDSDPSTKDLCQAECVHIQITECVGGDSYCPQGCKNPADPDCPECSRDLDCGSDDPCVHGKCSSGICVNEEAEGCGLDGECIALGTVKGDSYCGLDGLGKQKRKGITCSHDYECRSGDCKDTCRESFLGGIIAWFSSLFGK